MISNRQFAAMLPETIVSCINSSAPTFVFCSGGMPSDSLWDTVNTSIITTAGFIKTNTLATFPGAGLTLGLVDSAEIPPRWTLNNPTTTRSVAATAAGLIDWAVVYLANQYIFAVDVSLPNQGGMLQIDNTTVSVGTMITLLGFSFSAWR